MPLNLGMPSILKPTQHHPGGHDRRTRCGANPERSMAEISSPKDEDGYGEAGRRRSRRIVKEKPKTQDEPEWNVQPGAALGPAEEKRGQNEKRRYPDIGEDIFRQVLRIVVRVEDPCRNRRDRWRKGLTQQPVENESRQPEHDERNDGEPREKVHPDEEGDDEREAGRPEARPDRRSRPVEPVVDPVVRVRREIRIAPVEIGHVERAGDRNSPSHARREEERRQVPVESALEPRRRNSADPVQTRRYCRDRTIS